MRNPYHVLGLDDGATEADVKAAYRRLAAEFHPDKTGGDDSKIKEINSARDAILKGEWARHQQETSARRSGPFAHEFDIGGFDDLLRAFHASQRRRNPDIHATVNMTLEDSFFGKELVLLIPEGGGRREVRVRIPQGVDNGHKVRVNGAGGTTYPGLPPGDLFVNIAVAEHPIFARIGRNLVVKQQIDVFDAMLGGKTMVRGIDGSQIEVTIPPLIQPSTHLRLAGYGMPALHGGNRGDLLLVVDIRLPDALTAEQVALLARARSA